MIQQFHLWALIQKEKMKTLPGKDLRTSMSAAALFKTAVVWKQLKWPSVDEWMKDVWYTLDP